MRHGNKNIHDSISRGREVRRRLGSLAVFSLLALLSPYALAAVESGGEPEMAPYTLTTPADELDRAQGVGGLTFYFTAVSTFSPYDSSSTWVYQGAGCRSRSAGSPWYDHDLQIPDGSEIDFLRVFFYDNDSTNDVGAYLWSFDDAGDSDLIASAQGTGTPGFSSAGSGFFSHIVDTVNESLVVRVELESGSDGNLRACGVRLRYTPPLIFADGFESGDTLAWSLTVP